MMSAGSRAGYEKYGCGSVYNMKVLADTLGGIVFAMVNLYSGVDTNQFTRSILGK
jgi:hypothetical protein